MTVNDVILAICSGALRRYLLDINGLPKTLDCFLPLSLRDDNDSANQHVGNQITFILANLATHLADPVAVKDD